MRELSERFGLVVDPRAYVEDIGVGQQQRVEILRVLHRGADVLILDEPTAVLTAQEIAELFKVLRALTAEGVSVIFISHKLQRGAGDRRPRHGAAARQEDRHGADTEGATEASLAKLMVGRDVLFRVEKEAAARRRAGARGRRARGRGRPRAAGGARALAAGARAARSSASPASTATASPSWSRRSPGCARRAAGHVRVGGTRHHRRAACGARSRPASATSPRTATGAASSWTSRSPRTSRCASTGGRR